MVFVDGHGGSRERGLAQPMAADKRTKKMKHPRY